MESAQSRLDLFAEGGRALEVEPKIDFGCDAIHVLAPRAAAARRRPRQIGRRDPHAIVDHQIVHVVVIVSQLRKVDAEHAEILLTTMVLMTLADGRVVDDEVTRIRWIYGKLSDYPVDEVGIREIISVVQRDPPTLETYFEDHRKALDEDGKRRLLKAAFAIACADGRVVDAEDALLVRFAKALAIPPDVYGATLGHLKVALEFA